MPNKALEAVRVSGTVQDKRVKLSAEDKLSIIERHSQGEGIRALSRTFNVSRRAIQFLLFPERLEINKQLRADRGGSAQYYNKNKHTVYMQIHREHKREVLKTLVRPSTKITEDI